MATEKRITIVGGAACTAALAGLLFSGGPRPAGPMEPRVPAAELVAEVPETGEELIRRVSASAAAKGGPVYLPFERHRRSSHGATNPRKGIPHYAHSARSGTRGR